MSFSPLDKPLENLLRCLIETRRGAWSALEQPDELELQELERQGYIEKYDTYYDGSVSVRLSYQGLTYFQERQAAMEAGKLLDDHAMALLSDVEKASDSKSAYTCKADDQTAIRTLRWFGRTGLVKNFSADNIPYRTSITDKGKQVLAHGGNLDYQLGGNTRVDKSINISVGGNINASVQVQSGVVGSPQIALSSQNTKDEIIDKIIALKDNAEFNELFGDQAQEVQNYAEIAKESEGSTKDKVLGMIRDIAVKVGAAGITSGVLAVFSQLTGM